jgi:hypothetical protein
MEKCTYCVQRINQARARRRQGRREDTIADGAVVTRLPAGLPDRGDRLRRPQRPEPTRGSSCAHRDYGVLADMNTKPRTTYLARVRNPNPKLGKPWR